MWACVPKRQDGVVERLRLDKVGFMDTSYLCEFGKLCYLSDSLFSLLQNSHDNSPCLIELPLELTHAEDSHSA